MASKTFSTTCSKVGSFGYAENFKLYVELTEVEKDTAGNRSKVRYDVYCRKPENKGGAINARHLKYFKINGEEITNETVTVNVTGYPANIPIASGTTSYINHNTDGNKSITFSAKIKGATYGVSAAIEDSFSLDTIPRYFSKTPTVSLVRATETSVTIRWTTSEKASRTQYKVDNGSWVDVASNATSGEYTISGLKPNTKYTIYGDNMRADSGLWSQTKPSITITTYNYPYCTSSPNFTIGSDLTLQFYNPLNRTIQIQMWSHIGNQFVSDLITTNGTSFTGFRDITNRLYASIPNNASSYYNIDVYYNENKAIKEGGIYSIAGNESPSFRGFSIQSDSHYYLTKDYNKIIPGHSNIKGIISPENKAIPNYFAGSINEYKMVIGNDSQKANFSGNDTVIINLDRAKTNKVDMYAIDSRGLSTMKTVYGELLDYFNIKVNSLKASRVNNVNSETILEFNATFWNRRFGPQENGAILNSIKKILYFYKRTDSSSWIQGKTPLTFTASGDTVRGYVHISGDVGDDGFNIENSYNLKIHVEDELSSTELETIIPTGSPAIAIKGNKVAIGGKYDTSRSGTLQVYGDANFNGKAIIAKSTGNIWSEGHHWADQGFISMNVGSVGTPIGNSMLVIKRVQQGEAPNNGVVLEYGNSKEWAGQLYIADNPSEGLFVSGWANGVKSDWKRIPFDSDTLKIAKGTSYGLKNSDGMPIIRDHDNTNVTVDATGGDLYLGYDNTRYINILNDKVMIYANGFIKCEGLQGADMNATIIEENSTEVFFGTNGNLTGKTTYLRGNTVRIYSHTKGAVYLGSSGSTAITSDENLKNIYELDEKYIKFFDNLEPITYIYKNGGHRSHVGFGARQVERALLDAGLTTKKFAGVLKDTDVTIAADEMHTEEDVHFDELYSLRYEEFIALNTAKIKQQEKRIKNLENEVELLKEVLRNNGLLK